MVKRSSKLARVSRYCSGNMVKRGVGECMESEKDSGKQRKKQGAKVQYANSGYAMLE